MYAFVYIKTSNSYETVKTSHIDNFEDYSENLNLGHQSKEFSSRVFKYSTKKIAFLCQILIIADTKEQIEQYVQERRPRPPKLNNSAFEQDLNEDNSVAKQKSALKEQNKNIKKKKLANQNNAIKSIVDAYQNSLGSKSIPPNEHENEIQNEMQNDSEFLEIATDGYDEVLSQTSKRNSEVPSNNSEVESLKQQLLEEKRGRLLSDKVIEKLRSKMTRKQACAEEQLQQQDADRLGQQANERKCKIKGNPPIINTGSNVRAKKSAVDHAYETLKPSVFYISMVYATWGFKDLATRCVKKNKKTIEKNLKVMTPKKRRAIKKHFEHYLNYYEYQEPLYSTQVSSMNNYARRAINGAKKKLHLLSNIQIWIQITLQMKKNICIFKMLFLLNLRFDLINYNVIIHPKH